MADNYTALKSSQKKRYISKETFNSLDLSQIPVGSEYEVVSPIEKGDLSADINNALNKAEKSISEPTNQTTGSDGDVLVKKGGGSEWKSMPVPGVVQGTGQSTTDVMSQKAVTDELNKRPIVAANPGGGTENLTTLTVGPKTYNIPDTGVTGAEVTGSGNAITDASISGRTITLTKGATYALTTDIPDTSNLSTFSVEVW